MTQKTMLEQGWPDFQDEVDKEVDGEDRQEAKKKGKQSQGDSGNTLGESDRRFLAVLTGTLLLGVNAIAYGSNEIFAPRAIVFYVGCAVVGWMVR